MISFWNWTTSKPTLQHQVHVSMALTHCRLSSTTAETLPLFIPIRIVPPPQLFNRLQLQSCALSSGLRARGLPCACRLLWPSSSPEERLRRQKEPFSQGRKPSRDVEHVSWCRMAFPEPAKNLHWWSWEPCSAPRAISAFKMSSEWWNSTWTFRSVNSHCQSFLTVDLIPLSQLASS